MNYKVFSYLLLSILIVLTLRSYLFSEAVFVLDEKNINYIGNYEQLPMPVQLVIEEKIDQIVSDSYIFNYSIDKINFYFGASGRGKNWVNEIYSNYDHFFVDGFHYKIRSDRRKIIILYNNEVYYSQQTIYKMNYRLNTFSKIVLTP